jgi:hypothetical protein
MTERAIDSNALTQALLDEQEPPATVVAPNHDGGPGDPLCAHCAWPFKESARHKGRQKFGSVECRNAWHEARRGHGMAGRVSSVRILKRGCVSVTIRFDLLARFGKDSGKPVTNVVISSNVTLASQRPKDPGVAAYFTWDGIDTCFAVDRYRKLEDNLTAIAHVIDAERTKLRHGGLNLVRASFTGYMALPGSRSGRSWHEVLEVDVGASASAIADSYKRLRSSTHPDKGGSADAFRAVQTAYDEARSRGLVS